MRKEEEGGGESDLYFLCHGLDVKGVFVLMVNNLIEIVGDNGTMSLNNWTMKSAFTLR